VPSADRKVRPGRLEKTVLLGEELALDGRVRPVVGVLPAVIAAGEATAQRVTIARLLLTATVRCLG
jgi:predicted ATPase with chaperone activity